MPTREINIRPTPEQSAQHERRRELIDRFVREEAEYAIVRREQLMREAHEALSQHYRQRPRLCDLGRVFMGERVAEQARLMQLPFIA